MLSHSVILISFFIPLLNTKISLGSAGALRDGDGRPSLASSGSPKLDRPVRTGGSTADDVRRLLLEPELAWEGPAFLPSLEDVFPRR